jgi:hypothetical protein
LTYRMSVGCWGYPRIGIWLHSFIHRLLIVGLLVISMVFAAPSAHAQTCGFGILSVDSPATLATNQSFEIDTKVSVNCDSTKNYVTVVVDVEELPSNIVLSTTAHLFPLETFAGLSGVANTTSQWSANATLHNQLTAPSITSSWTLQVQAFLYYQYTGAAGSAQQSPFTIQVGQVQPTVRWANISLIQNGGFEDGLANWQETQGVGRYAISHKTVHAGGSSLWMYMPLPPIPPTSSGPGPSMTVTQTNTVTMLRGLYVEAWADGLVRLRVKFAGLMVDYDFGQGSTTMSIGCGGCAYGVNGVAVVRVGLADSGCNGVWCSLERNVTSDVQPFLTISRYASIFNLAHPVQVTLSVFLHQFLPVWHVSYVDDIQLFAYVPQTAQLQSPRETTSAVTVGRTPTAFGHLPSPQTGPDGLKPDVSVSGFYLESPTAKHLPKSVE